MNERIDVLALQATDSKGGLDRHRFAELILRECIEHLEGTVLVPNIEHSRTKTKCIRSIKEHFGVE